MAALSIISDIVTTQHAMAKQYTSIIQGLLDYFDLATVTNINQIRKIYNIFCDLYFGDPFVITFSGRFSTINSVTGLFANQ